MLALFPKLKTYSNIIDGSESFIISKLYSENNSDILFIAHNEKTLIRIKDEIRFYIKDTEIITFHHWDCLPYDRVSPSNSIVSSRIKALYEASINTGRKIILTTIEAIVQQTINKDILLKNIFKINSGDVVDREELILFLTNKGFIRTSIASESGNFAVRGSIIDLYDIYANNGIRIDFIGNKVETIKAFNPITQISKNTLEHYTVLPASEIIRSQEYISNFKESYQKLFNTSGSNDLLYETISSGGNFFGIEHWLPLFYKKLDNLFDYLNKDTMIIFNSDLLHDFHKYNQTIDDYLNSRQEGLSNKNLKNDFIYNPVPKNLMWLDLESLITNINKFKTSMLNKFGTDENKENLKLVPNLHNQNKSLITQLIEHKKNTNKKILLSCFTEGSLTRLKNLLDNENLHCYLLNQFKDYKNISAKSYGITISSLEKGFEAENFVIITESELFGHKINRSPKSTKKIENLLNEAATFQKGELVVHAEHGIGKFEGLQTLVVSGVNHDFLLIIYEGGDKLYLPIENIELLTKYGEDEGNVKLDKLGAISWQDRKARIKNRIREISAELLKIAAARTLIASQIFTPDAKEYDNFVARFPYIETNDQINAISEVEQDLASGVPMDRLICGDVGFGKTEIALRAAFIVTNPENNQKGTVAVIVPTTILAKQHYENFVKRFSGLGVNIKELSRFVSSKEAKQVKIGLEDGSIDIVIGTHALFSKDIKFKNLQLLIIDEEQHFGVVQKEKLKQLRSEIHILTLSATPIPRTMQMSMVGIKDLSLIATPPIDRIAIATYIMPYDNLLIREAIYREKNRNGKCFFIAPRIADLKDIETLLRQIVPDIKTVSAHGKIKSDELDKIMHDFYNGKYDILIATTIIESGLDIPNANTIFIHRADMLGLSALYQLRGRVGRGSNKSYAYLLLPNIQKISKIAEKRLEVMQTLDSLGMGFTIASHDMDIRGFGNLLGDEQSGHIKEIGVELYQEMLKDSIDELKNNVTLEKNSWSPQINIGIPVLIPEYYIPDIQVRMGIYRRLATLSKNSEIDDLKFELIDRFGKYPQDVEYLLTTLSLKILCKKANIDKLDAGNKGVVIGFRDNKFSKPDKLIELGMSSPNIKIRSDERIVFTRIHEDINNRVKFVFQIVNQIVNLI